MFNYRALEMTMRRGVICLAKWIAIVAAAALFGWLMITYTTVVSIVLAVGWSSILIGTYGYDVYKEEVAKTLREKG